MNAEDSISSEGWFDFSMIGKMLQVRLDECRGFYFFGRVV